MCKSAPTFITNGSFSRQTCWDTSSPYRLLSDTGHQQQPPHMSLVLLNVLIRNITADVISSVVLLCFMLVVSSLL